MTVDIKFYTVSERQPKHGESIIYLRSGYSFDSHYFEPRNIVVEYQWTELDEDGQDTGSVICYNPRSKVVPKGCRLDMLFDGEIVTEEMLWCPTKEYWGYFKEYDKMCAKVERMRAKEHLEYIKGRK